MCLRLTKLGNYLINMGVWSIGELNRFKRLIHWITSPVDDLEYREHGKYYLLEYRTVPIEIIQRHSSDM